MTGVGSSPALATCETSHVLHAVVPGGFSQGSPVFAHLLIGPSHMSCNNLERDVKLNLKKKNHLKRLIFMSPPDRVGRHIVFPRASVCPSVRLSVTNRVRSITCKPLKIFQ